MRYTNRSKVATNTREPNGQQIGSVPNKIPELKYDLNGDGNYSTLHWQTVIESGEGDTVETYAADTVSGEFRYETADDYYDEHSVPEAKRKITIYEP